ncbi:response regulator [Mucilaginibacter gotjawali]|uniref:Response regulator rcp1 n=2 Tax=Mucilaginibacter gotjawali TaxID=1550579 RepID=A0A0X8X226_9SPHI|nr:response regulator [Mucilaginibacter gotjawali]MBB3054065.1 CheY-like chemotaxis protein [Mucilaginibacter gotjawali]BAU54334.1 Response regulator rcp1 [Mucilaginibacter gotjawali]
MKPIKILLVEDNEGDIVLTCDALEDCRIVNEVTVIRDGESAINFFKNLKDKDSRPDLVLLDINLPKKNGIEVLIFLKNNETYKQMPVIMLTTSSSEKDITLSYKNYANCYITKPIEVAEFMEAITKIEEFWFNIVTIPQR